MPAVSSLQFQKCLLSEYCDFATRISKASTETQSIGIHDVYSFNTELAMHYRAIFQYGFFLAVLLAKRSRDFVAMFWSIFLVIKANRTGVADRRQEFSV